MERILEAIIKISDKWQSNRVRKRMSSVLAIIIVFVTVYSLILPALTLDNNVAAKLPGTDAGSKMLVYDCRTEVHQHTDSCYEKQPVLDKKGNETGKTKKVLICGKSDYIVHEHDENCWQTIEKTVTENGETRTVSDRVLVCTLPEVAEHVHGVSCYDEEGNLTCGKQALHTHTAECYETGPNGESPEEMGWIHYEQDEDGNQVLVGDPKHLICGQMELLRHQHGEDCYTVEDRPAEEIAQEEANAAENAGAAEDAAQDANTENTAENADTAEEAVSEADAGGNAAVSEAGAGEGENGAGIDAPDADADGAAAGTEEDSAANENAADNAAENDAGSDDSGWYVLHETSEEESADDADKKEAADDADKENSAGDKDKKETAAGSANEDAAGKSAGDKELSEITDDAIPAADTAKDGSDVNPDAAKDGEAIYDAKSGTWTAVVQAEGGDYSLRITYGDGSGIPEDAVFRATAITEENIDYASYRSRAEETITDNRTENSTEDAQAESKVLGLFDLCIFDAEGEKIQPEAPLSVTVEFDGELGSTDTEVYAVHFPGTDLEDGEVVEEAVKPNLAQSYAKKLTESKLFKMNDYSTEIIDAAYDGEQAVRFEADSFSLYAIVGTTVIEKTVLASDGKNYRITATYGEDAGIPEDAQLAVEEILSESDLYGAYVSKTESVLGLKEGTVGYIRMFDIKIVDKDDPSVKYQPAAGSGVDVRIELADADKKDLNVVHFSDEDDQGSAVEAETEGKTVNFKADGFSVYVVVDHEGGNVVTPRVEFHFIDKYSDEQYAAGVPSGTPASPYNFINNDGTYQTTQILKDGESLELIVDPGNVRLQDGAEKYFYGWYIVSKDSDSTILNDNGRYTGSIAFDWPENPDQIRFEQPISIEMSGDTVTWTLDGVTGTGTMDDTGTVHVYLAPLYEDFYFINFHKGPKEDTTGLENSLITRRLVVFGSSDRAKVRIGDVICDSPDPSHKIFAGWETITDSNTTDQYYQTVQHIIDAEGNLTNEEVNNPSDKNGYYIDVEKNGRDVTVLDLYPVFDEARWLYFDRGASGNGATYVGASYRLTNDGVTVESDRYYFDDTFFTGTETAQGHLSRRAGYEFEGWYLFANKDQVTGEITNLDTPQTVTIKYVDDDGTVKNATITTTAVKAVDSDGHIQNIGAYYVSEDGTISQDSSGKKLFEVDENGRLRFYKTMDDMTMFANWIVQPTTYRVIIWKQKVTDDKNTSKTPVDLLNWLAEDSSRRAEDYPYTIKEYDYEIFYTSDTAPSDQTPDLTHFSGSYVDENGNTQNVNNINLLNRSYTGFHYSNNDVTVIGTPSPDGTTVYNVYYDRDLRAINYYYYNRTPSVDYYDAYTYTVTTSNNGTQYGLVNDQYVRLSYDSETGTWGIPEYAYQYQVDNENGSYGLVDGEYVELTPVTEETITYTADYRYTLVTNNNGTQYSLTNNEYNEIERYNSNWYQKVGTANNGVSNDVIYINGQNYYYRETDWWGDSSYSSLYYNNNRWRTENRNNNYYNHTGDIYQRYSGTRYSRSADGSTNVTNSATLNIEELYYIDGNGGKVPVTANSTTTIIGYTYDNNGTPTPYTGENRYSYDYVATGGTTEYSATRFTRSNNTLGNDYHLVTWSGLYGQNFAQNGYSWDDVSSYYWREGTTPGSGTGQTFLDSFIQDTNPYNLVTNSNRGNFTLYHYRQQLDGSYTIDDREAAYLTLGTGNTTFNLTNKFDGFTVDSFNKGANGFSSTGGSSTGSSTSIRSSDSALHVYHTRNKYDFTFDVNYPVDAGITYGGKTLDEGGERSENLTVANIYYEAPLNEYGSTASDGQTHWYYGIEDADNTAEHDLIAPDHYIFEGWFEDAACTVPFNFNSKMPVGNKIVYAKWTPETFWVKIDPAGGEIDRINHNGYTSYGAGFEQFTPEYLAFSMYTGANAINSSGQATYVRTDYGEPVTEYQIPRRFVELSESAAEQYEEEGGTVYYYLNCQLRDTDGASGLYTHLRSALYLTEEEIEHYYELYKAIVNYSLRTNPAANAGMELLDFSTWKQLYVEDTKYRPLNVNEKWTHIGWFKDDETMPYNFSDPVTESFTLTEHWRLDGGYAIQYVPEYTMPDGLVINGQMPSWRDPESETLTYADDAATEIYKQPTDLTKDDGSGATEVTDDSVVFRGWALVIKTGTDEHPVYSLLDVDDDGNITKYYNPSDAYTVHAAHASADGNIYFQAIYQYRDASDRQPKVTNLVLDANTGYVNSFDSADLPEWEYYPGTSAINSSDHLDGESRPTQIEFGDIQASAAVHLYRYATDETHDEVTGTNFFTHPDGYFLLGFDDGSTEGDYVATYPADSVIAITRDDDQTIYAVWEPMVYVTFVNDTGVTAHDVTFGLSAADTEALQVINVKDGMYERRPLSDYGSISLADGESITLAFPKGAERTLTVSGTNDLGVGKVLQWNSSIDLVDTDGTTTEYTTVGSGSDTVSYNHTTSAGTHSHDLVSGEALNTHSFSFNEDMIVNANALTVTFTSRNVDYALLLDDNYPGGSVQEIDYELEEIQPVDGVPQSQDLPRTSTRIGYSFAGWATSAQRAADGIVDYSASNDWKITDLNKDDGFFSHDTETINDVVTRTLYAVWEARTDAVYIYKDVPAPGKQTEEFGFTLQITGSYKYGNGGSYTENIDKSQEFNLKHGEYLKISSSNYSPGEGAGNNQTAYVQAVVEVYTPVNENGTTSYQLKDDPVTVRWEKTGLTGYRTNRFDNLQIQVNETPVQYYDTSVSLNTQNGDHALTIGENSYESQDLPKTESTNTVSWTNTDAGGTAVFINQRETYDVTVGKDLTSNTGNPVIFNFTASYQDGDDTTRLDDFTVTSGGTKTLEDIPAGATLTITEVTDTDNNYMTRFTLDGGTSYEEGKESAFIVNEDKTVTFDNTLKSYPVTFRLVDQNDNPLQAMFTLASSVGSLGEHYANTQGQFYQSDEFWADVYTLNQTTTPNGYISLQGTPVTLTVTGKSGEEIVSNNPWVTVKGNPQDGFVVTVKNWQEKDVTVRKVLSDPLLTSTRAFGFSYSYLSPVDGGTVNGTFTLAPAANDTAGVGRILTIPVNATNLTVTELTDGDYAYIPEIYGTDIDIAAFTEVAAGELFDSGEIYYTKSSSGFAIADISEFENGVKYYRKNTDSVTGTTYTMDTVTADSEFVFSNTRKDSTINLKKVDDKNQDLSGAKFELFVLNSSDSYEKCTLLASNGKLIPSSDDAASNVIDLTLASNAVLQLPVGEYKLVEKQAPKGYVITSSEIMFAVNNGNVTLTEQSGVSLDTTHALTQNTYILTVINNPGAELPHTGGSGTNLIYLLGIMLTGFAGAGLVMKKRKRAA